MSRSPYVECVACGRTVGAFVPKGGDGTGLMTRRHKRPSGDWCYGWTYLVEDEVPTPVRLRATREARP